MGSAWAKVMAQEVSNCLTHSLSDMVPSTLCGHKTSCKWFPLHILIYIYIYMYIYIYIYIWGMICIITAANAQKYPSGLTSGKPHFSFRGPSGTARFLKVHLLVTRFLFKLRRERCALWGRTRVHSECARNGRWTSSRLFSTFPVFMHYAVFGIMPRSCGSKTL